MPGWKDYEPELLTDLYELTMADSYLQEGMSAQATFSLFIRDYPRDRAYFVAAGIEHAISLISSLTFSHQSLDYLSSISILSPKLIDYLRAFRFTGSVRALPEGAIFFANEPILEVTAPIIEAQIIETIVINVVQLETMIASKAARCITAAKGRPVIDFSLRRDHGVEAGVKVARASYLAGFAGTSNLLAGKLYSIPVVGTMAHSYVTSFPSEIDAFRSFARAFPRNTVLLIDTYDTLAGAKKAIQVAGALKAQSHKLNGVRLDSGDLTELSRAVRALLDEAGFSDVRILVSGSLDEYRIRDLLEEGAIIDSFAVGTRMGVSADAPYLDIAYKLVEYEGRPILKLSTGKETWVGQKQVFRFYDGLGRMAHDVLGLACDRYEGATPLLREAVVDGKAVQEPEPLETIRKRLAQQLAALPEPYRDITPSRHYPVEISPALKDLQERAVQRVLIEEKVA